MKNSDFSPNKKNILNDKEIDYAINLTQADIQFFIRYKGQLKKFAVDNRSQINKANMVKIFSEIERITLHIVNLKNQEQELITLLDKIFYS
jgi:hypothetical protein